MCVIFKVIFLPSAMKLRRLCFYRCVSVHRGVSAPGWCLVPGGLLRGGAAWSQGGCLVPAGSAPRGCLVWGGGLLWGVCPEGGGLVLGGGIPGCTEADLPWERQLLLRTVRILLECILVFMCNSFPKKSYGHLGKINFLWKDLNKTNLCFPFQILICHYHFYFHHQKRKV